jgi:hypothetical protein
VMIFCSMFFPFLVAHCAGIVTTGAPSLPLVSTSVKRNIKNENSRLEGISWSAMANR